MTPHYLHLDLDFHDSPLLTQMCELLAQGDPSYRRKFDPDAWRDVVFAATVRAWTGFVRYFMSAALSASVSGGASGGLSAGLSGGHTAQIPDSLVESWANWRGKRGIFPSVFRRILCHDDDEMSLRGYYDRYGKFIEQRAREAERKRISRKNGQRRPADSPADSPADRPALRPANVRPDVRHRTRTRTRTETSSTRSNELVEDDYYALGDRENAGADQPVSGSGRQCTWLPHRAEAFAGFPNPILPQLVAAKWEDLLGDVPDDLVPVMAGFVRAQRQPVLMIGTLVGIADRDGLGGEEVALAVRDLTMQGVVVPSTKQLAAFAKRAEDEARQNRVARVQKATSAVSEAPRSPEPASPEPAPAPRPVRPVVPLPGSSAARSGPQPMTSIAAILPTPSTEVSYDA